MDDRSFGSKGSKSLMSYTLMHKDQPVLECLIDSKTGVIAKINEVHSLEHAPLGGLRSDGKLDRHELNSWWVGRSIPSHRMHIQNVLDTLGVNDTKMLLTKSFGLSLSDQYWVKPQNSNISWEQVNFFTNTFSEDLGDLLLGLPVDKSGKDIDLNVPDNTSDGYLEKGWKIFDGVRCLVKAGEAPFYQQPFNEVIAADLMERLGVSHAEYSVCWLSEKPYCVTPDIVDVDHEIVPMAQVLNVKKQKGSESIYQHTINCCKDLGFDKVEKSLNEMMVIDYILGNEDRHFNNFGLMRNAQTLEIEGLVPLFDTGSSLGYNKIARDIRAERDMECKPFRKKHEDQIKLVKDLSWVDFNALADFSEKIREVFKGAEELVGKDRIDAICHGVEKRIGRLKEMSATLISEPSL